MTFEEEIALAEASIESKIDKSDGVGASEVAKLFTKDRLKSATAKTFQYEKAVQVVTGWRKNISTSSMDHGINNEEITYNDIVKPLYPFSIYRSDESILIEDGFWATPDVTDEIEDIVIDMKMPNSIQSYWANVKKPKSGYLLQVNCQMLATGLKKGALCFYLLAQEGQEPYKIKKEDRATFVKVERDESVQDEMKVLVREFRGLVRTLVDEIHDAPIVENSDFFHLFKNNKVTELKQKSNWYNWKDQIVRNQNKFFVIEKL